MAANDPTTDLPERTPRYARFTASTQTARFFLTLLFVGGTVLMLGLANRDLKDLSSLKAIGRTTTADIIGKHETSGKTTSYYLDYDYEGSAETVDDEKSVSWSDYVDAKVGDPMTVTYLPSHPTTHRIGLVTDDRIQAEQAHWGWIGLFTVLILGGIFLAAEINYRRHLALLRDGRIAQGEIMDRRIVKGKSYSYYVRYQFELNGVMQTREVSVPARVYNALPEGTNVTVLYDPQHLTRSYPYQALTDVTLAT